MNPFLSYLQSNQDYILKDLQALVAKQSPSQDKAHVDQCGEFLTTLFQNHLDARCEKFNRETVGDHLLFKIGNGAHKTLLLGHFDTVWDIDRLGTRIEDGKLFGPGTFDMKAGLIQGLWAIKALQECHALDGHQIWFLCTTDEEIGSLESRELIEDVASQCNEVLVLEPSVEGSGNLKVGRKGVGNFFMTIHGKASHAGNDPLAGISTAEEMAQQILWINKLQDMSRGTSVNVGIAQSGSRINVIPDNAKISIDVRVTTLEEAKRIEKEIFSAKPFKKGITLEVTGGLSRPPMEENSANLKLLSIAQKCAIDLDFTLEGSSVGGGSDGNFTSALNIPTLDGLGAEGGGPHAEYEHIVIEGLPRRAALVAQLISQLK